MIKWWIMDDPMVDHGWSNGGSWMIQWWIMDGPMVDRG